MGSENVREEKTGTDPAHTVRAAGRTGPLVPWWASLGAVAALAGFARDVLGGVSAADEAWFLYVLHRVSAGQALYRDIWAPVFPLAIWVGAAFTSVFGDNIFTLKALSALCFAGTVIACVSVVRRVSPRYDHTALVLAVMLGWATPGEIGPGSLYTALSYGLLAASLAVALAWIDSGTEGRGRRLALLLAAAALAGLAFSAKQTVGGFAVMALVTTVVLGGDLRRPGPTLVAVAGAAGAFTAAVLVTVAPVALAGGWSAMLRDTLPVGANTSYLSLATIPYSEGLQRLGQLLLHPTSGWWLSAVTRSAVFALPLVAVPALIGALATKRDLRGSAIGVFCLAALAGAFPRTDYPHLVAAVPLLLIALVFAWEALRPRIAPLVRLLVVVLVVVLVGARLGSLVAEPFRGGDRGVVVSGLAHFRGAPVAAGLERDATAAAAQLRAAPQATVFVLSLRAGLLYLASGRENATRYDYPDFYGLGPRAQDEVIDAVRAGRVQAIWLDPAVLSSSGGGPSRLVAYVRAAMRPTGPETAWGRLYVPVAPAP